jgi:hypothetical protein
MDLVNPYKPGIELNNFPDLYSKVVNDFDIVCDTCIGRTTPRFRIHKSIVLKDIFYYINLLYDNNPRSIIDLGCGECVWKDYFPNIIGVDRYPSKYSSYDFVGCFDEEFSKEHKNKYDCGMALGSLHYTNWNEIRTQIELAMEIVKDRFLITLNFSIFDRYTSVLLNYLDKVKSLNDILSSLPYNIVMLDYPIQRGYSLEDITNNHGVNGHVRFILEHRR